jgi:uncharacterized protein YukE
MSSFEKIHADSKVGNMDGPAWNPFNDMMGTLKDILNNIDTKSIGAAGDSFKNVADRLDASLKTIHDHSKRLSEAWGGKAADGALKQMKKMGDSAVYIYNASDPAGVALQDHKQFVESFRQSLHQLDTGVGPNVARYGVDAMVMMAGGPVTALAADRIGEYESA